jgi:hypothetical protein
MQKSHPIISGSSLCLANLKCEFYLSICVTCYHVRPWNHMTSHDFVRCAGWPPAIHIVFLVVRSSRVVAIQ